MTNIHVKINQSFVNMGNVETPAKTNKNDAIVENNGQLSVNPDTQEGTTVMRTQEVTVNGDGSYTVYPDNGDGKHFVRIFKGDEVIELDYDNHTYNGEPGYSDEELDGKQGKHGVYPPL